VARQRYPDDDLAAKVAARALFDAEETAAYAADLDAQAEVQGFLDMARAATRLRGELREELRAKGSGAGGTEDEYLHLDDADLDDDLAYLELPTDEEAVESAAEQRALMASTSLPGISWRPREGQRRTSWRRRTKTRANRYISVTWQRWTRRGRQRRDGGPKRTLRG
jgi:hypothetical protein